MTNNLQDRIQRARAAAPADTPKEIPPNSFKISGYWEKDNKEASSWVARAVGIKIDDKSGDERLDLSFVSDHSIEWLGKKGEGAPKGIKTWYLPEGIYKAKITSNANAKPEYIHFAVVNGNREDLAENQVFAILQDAFDGPQDSPETAPPAKKPKK